MKFSVKREFDVLSSRSRSSCANYSYPRSRTRQSLKGSWLFRVGVRKLSFILFLIFLISYFLSIDGLSKGGSLKTIGYPFSYLTELIVLVFVPIFFGVGCSTMSKEECGEADWNHVGYIDGRMGKSELFIEEHKRACGISDVDTASYNEGRRRGLKEYCTSRSAYDIGAQGLQLADLCPEAIKPELWSQYLQGRKTFELKTERRKVQKEFEKERERIESDRSVVGSIAKTFSLLTGVSGTQDKENHIALLSDKINSRDMIAPPGPPALPTLEERIGANPVGAFKNFFAISVGSTIGFGAGHSIQGKPKRVGSGLLLMRATSQGLASCQQTAD